MTPQAITYCDPITKSAPEPGNRSACSIPEAVGAVSQHDLLGDIQVYHDDIQVGLDGDRTVRPPRGAEPGHLLEGHGPTLPRAAERDPGRRLLQRVQTKQVAIAGLRY